MARSADQVCNQLSDLLDLNILRCLPSVCRNHNHNNHNHNNHNHNNHNHNNHNHNNHNHNNHNHNNHNPSKINSSLEMHHVMRYILAKNL